MYVVLSTKIGFSVEICKGKGRFVIGFCRLGSKVRRQKADFGLFRRSIRRNQPIFEASKEGGRYAEASEAAGCGGDYGDI